MPAWANTAISRFMSAWLSIDPDFRAILMVFGPCRPQPYHHRTAYLHTPPSIRRAAHPFSAKNGRFVPCFWWVVRENDRFLPRSLIGRISVLRLGWIRGRRAEAASTKDQRRWMHTVIHPTLTWRASGIRSSRSPGRLMADSGGGFSRRGSCLKGARYRDASEKAPGLFHHLVNIQTLHAGHPGVAWQFE
uniref:Uncharacterized protein n=1 Tax=Candidatus Kentrum sp. LPFa TaxID=2126335 RepID=A0A450WGV1_9GAMM|nr:MAG: hypothetical protein BECKLPF1236B_GA0070989_109113 [Candidatus Kentron sp. LPFa]